MRLALVAACVVSTEVVAASSSMSLVVNPIRLANSMLVACRLSRVACGLPKHNHSGIVVAARIKEINYSSKELAAMIRYLCYMKYANLVCCFQRLILMWACCGAYVRAVGVCDHYQNPLESRPAQVYAQFNDFAIV